MRVLNVALYMSFAALALLSLRYSETCSSHPHRAGLEQAMRPGHRVVRPLLIGQASSQYGNTESYLLNFSGCSSKCEFTSDWKHADVVFANVGKTEVRRTSAQQLWVGTFWESLGNYPAKSFDYDFTLSYSPVSSFPNFAMIRDTVSDMNQLRVPLSFGLKKKNLMTSMWISNCRSKNNRVEYISKLKAAGVTVESYGKCQRTRRPIPDTKEVVAGKHLFLLAFENVDCVDYVTEKVFHGFRAGTVPVYMGTRSVIRDVPFHSIIQTSNFRSPSHLADYLLYLSTNETEYNSYFEWRQNGFPPRMSRKIALADKFGTDEWRCEACHLFHERRFRNIHVPKNHLTCTRRWQKIISFSMYGSDSIYTQGMISNARLAADLYPGWTVRVYHDNSASRTVLYSLQALDVELVDMTSSPVPKMQWRFLPMDDPQVSHFIVRDSDSRLSTRERDAVSEWVSSDLTFHSMRDHPFHKLLFMGGCWGAKAGAVPNFRDKILEYDANQKSPPPGSWGKDQNFLNRVLSSYVNATNILQHDAFHCLKFKGGKTTGFPGRRYDEDHVGSKYSSLDKRLTGCPMTSPECQSPPECRRHPDSIFG